MGKKNINIEGIMDPSEVSGYLREIADSLDRGRVVIERDRDFVELSPQGAMDARISARAKKDRQSLSVKLSWDTPAKDLRAPEIRISSERPDPPGEEDDAEEQANDSADTGKAAGREGAKKSAGKSGSASAKSSKSASSKARKASAKKAGGKKAANKKARA